jgi:hypothetical protein
VASATFWRKLKKEFRRLAEGEYTAVPDPADDRRLHAHGDYTGGRRGRIGCWRLSDGPSSDFRTLFDETATRAGAALGPSPAANPIDFWLHRLFHNLLEMDEKRRIEVISGGG